MEHALLDPPDVQLLNPHLVDLDDPFDLDIRVADIGEVGEPVAWTITTRLVTRVTCGSCTCFSCITRCPLGCW